LHKTAQPEEAEVTGAGFLVVEQFAKGEGQGFLGVSPHSWPEQPEGEGGDEGDEEEG